MDQEIKEGRGCGPHKDYVLLKLDHLGADVIIKRLPAIREIAHQVRQRRSDHTEPIPVVPTIHYQMGGMPTNIHGQVVAPKDGDPNAVVDGPVRGRRMRVRVACTAPTASAPIRCSTCWCSAARPAITSSSSNLPAQPHKPLPADAGDAPLARLARLDARDRRRVRRRTSRNDLRKTMQAHCGVFRTQALLAEGVRQGHGARRARASASRSRTSRKVFNTARVEALELDNLIETAQGDDRVGGGAQGSRGAHARAATIPKPRRRATG